MKKIISILVVTLSLLLTVNVFAGDIPESLLSDQAQLFFGEVVDYHPDKENPSIGVSPVKVIKGDMWKRFEKYLNEGKYGEARIEGKTPMVPKIIVVAAGGSVLFLAGGVFFIYKRKRRMK